MHTKTIALCAAAMVAALIVVGVVSNGIARHVVQIAPALLAVVAGAAGARATKWIALPVFVFWLLISAMIWLFLFGLSHIITGSFSPLEIAMTIVVGVAALFGIGLSVSEQSGMSWASGLATLVIVAALQVGAMWLSTQPHFANDTDFKAWIAPQK